MGAKRSVKSKSAKASKHRHERETEGGATGALAGATMGAIAGPPGAVARRGCRGRCRRSRSRSPRQQVG
jgi:hypothetical protein